MRADHPIALGAKWLHIAVGEAKACAREAHGCAALLYMDELKLGTYFSGKGGGWCRDGCLLSHRLILLYSLNNASMLKGRIPVENSFSSLDAI